MSKVSLITSNKSYDGTLKALEPFKSKLESKISELDRIVIKINFVTSEKELATTPYESVHAFTDFVKPFFKGKIIIAEEATVGDTNGGFMRFGFSELAQNDSQIEVFDSSKSKSKKVKVSWSGGEISFSLAEIYADSSFVVSAARAKTHDTVVVTLSIKNLIVGAIQQKLLVRRGSIHKGMEIHSIMTQLAKYVYPDFSIVDGVVGMQGNGPIDGEAIESEWVSCGFNALAVDSLSAYLMGFEIDDIGYFNMLKNEGYGNLYSKDNIEVVGELPDDLVKLYKPHSSFERQRAWSG